MRVLVVLPERWKGLHAFDDPMCWCKPRVIWNNGVPVIVHNNPRGDMDTKWLLYDEESTRSLAAA